MVFTYKRSEMISNQSKPTLPSFHMSPFHFCGKTNIFKKKKDYIMGHTWWLQQANPQPTALTFCMSTGHVLSTSLSG